MSNSVMKKRIIMFLWPLQGHMEETHPISKRHIMEQHVCQNMSVDRKALSDNLQLLPDRGYDVIKIENSPNRHFIGDRTFGVSVQKLLIEAVQSSRFTTYKISQELLKKLTGLVSSSQAKQLERRIYATDRANATNEVIYYNVDVIIEDINTRKKSTFSTKSTTAGRKKISEMTERSTS